METNSESLPKFKKAGIRKRLPSPKHYIVYPVTIQGQKDLNADMRRKTRVGRSSHWQIAIVGKPSLNANNMHIDTNSKIATSTSQTKVNFAKDSKIRLKSSDIYSQKGLRDKNVYARTGWHRNMK